MAYKRKVTNCENCKQLRTVKGRKLGRELCSSCFNYENRHGVVRPERLFKRAMFCEDCKVRYRRTKGLCSTCYNYRSDHDGKKRPAYHRNKHKAHCKNPNCRIPLRLVELPVKGYCRPCRQYSLRKGVDRPIRLARFMPEPGYEEVCKNPGCDKPVRPNNGRAGRCSACCTWYRKNGQERPGELCPKRIDIGWCECGQPATKKVSIRIGTPLIESKRKLRKEELILCDDCHKELNAF